MKAYERLLKYVVIPTPSDENSSTVPSSSCQFDLANVLVEELLALGIKDAYVDEKCYVYAHIPATPGLEELPVLGFIAHMDTVSDFCTKPITPVLRENYDGNDLPLGGEDGRILSVEMFPHLTTLKGRTLITTNGDTILGADDKAGVAEIMTLAERVISENIPHGPLAIAFTPDEEIGEGATHFNLDAFAADFAFTLDGDTEGEIQYENFNACSAVFETFGVNVHPGSSKDVMVNASLLAMEINHMIPSGETPRDTDGYEGFYHLMHMSGDVAHAKLSYIIRDHSAEKFAKRQEILRNIEGAIKEKWGEGSVILTIKEQYRNMDEIIKDGNMHLIDNAIKAAKAVGITPIVTPIRGGTDGCRLSFDGLPCPNLGTGGHSFHGPYEHISVEGMDMAVDMAVELVKLYAVK